MHRLIFTALVTVLLCGASWGQARMTDAQADGLKGKVKEVSYELQRIEWKDGELKTEKRDVSHLTTYDQRGREVEYSFHSFQGTLVRWIYLNINGHRAMKIEMAQKEAEPQGKIFSGPPLKGPKSPDSRYDHLYLDTYDQRGNRTEVVMVINNGRVSNVQTHKYDENRNKIEWALWRELEAKRQLNQAIISPKRDLDKLPQRTIEVDGRKWGVVREFYCVFKYDPAGILKKSTVFDNDGKIESQTTYGEYEFDAHKNWIKRTNFRVETKNGKEALIPEMIEYQVIKYYP